MECGSGQKRFSELVRGTVSVFQYFIFHFIKFVPQKAVEKLTTQESVWHCKGSRHFKFKVKAQFY